MLVHLVFLYFSQKKQNKKQTSVDHRLSSDVQCQISTALSPDLSPSLPSAKNNQYSPFLDISSLFYKSLSCLFFSPYRHLTAVFGSLACRLEEQKFLYQLTYNTSVYFEKDVAWDM